MRWYAALRAKKNSDRTIYNKHVSVFGFLSWAGVDTKKLTAKAPTFTEKAVEVYRADELKTFVASLSNPYQRIVFEVLLKTGLRMREAMHQILSSRLCQPRAPQVLCPKICAG
ncbi:MAG: hypothetical protein WBE76_24705 [Terracidiphilus sp.]